MILIDGDLRPDANPTHDAPGPAAVGGLPEVSEGAGADDALPDTRCLALGWPAAFSLDGHRFGCLAQYLAWRRAWLLGDAEACTAALATTNLDELRALDADSSQPQPQEGRWAELREDALLVAVRAVHLENPELARHLLATGDEQLAYASTDRVWGTGVAAASPSADDPTAWTGENLVGRVLEQVRAELSPSR